MIRIEEVNRNGERMYALYINGERRCVGNMNAVNLCLYLLKGGTIKMK